MKIRCRGPMVRREFMRIGSLALGGMALPQVLAGRASAGQSGQDTAVILLYLHGGPSQLETYDLKPDAPLDYRSVFNPIRTNVAGMEICELFPLQAKLGDKIALVRSLHHRIHRKTCWLRSIATWVLTTIAPSPITLAAPCRS